METHKNLASNTSNKPDIFEVSFRLNSIFEKIFIDYDKFGRDIYLNMVFSFKKNSPDGWEIESNLVSEERKEVYIREYARRKDGYSDYSDVIFYDQEKDTELGEASLILSYYDKLGILKFVDPNKHVGKFFWEGGEVLLMDIFHLQET